jgi:hypothetical protein
MPPASFESRASSAAAVASQLQGTSQLWRGRDIAPIAARSTGFPQLDRLLPGHGWPVGALIELIAGCEGIGELSLPMPVLRELCAQDFPAAFISPPHIPYAPALKRAGLPLSRLLWIDAACDDDARWAAEQMLRAGGVGAILLWSETHENRALRRLQLAAETGRALAFVYRSPKYQAHASPAALRLVLEASPRGLAVDVIKARGGLTGRVLLDAVRICPE